MERSEPCAARDISQERDKAIRLFTYLKDLCALRITQIHNVETYDQVFWLSDLPRHKLCRSTIWRLTDPSPAISDQPAVPWIEIRKPVLKSPPELPDDLEPWIKDEEISDSSLNEPGIHEQILLSALRGDSRDTDPKAFASINDYPHVFEKWIGYLEAKWKPWAVEDRELQKVQKAYNQLFSIYQRQEKLGEQYEVVFGAGLLLWKSPGSSDIKRHVLVIQGRLEFDRIRGIMSAGPSLDGAQPMIECSMLETSDRPNPTDLTNIENDVIAMDGDPWDGMGIECVLKGFANSLPIAGEYFPILDHGAGVSPKPIIRLAPALILRKRTRRTFEDFYRLIIDQIKEGEAIPENIRRIIDIVDDPPIEGREGVDIESSTIGTTPSDTELYFPLHANDAQKQIVQKIERRQGILVQGPPGTGKSHTIANLISHFLAKGKRILVTSETPRALEVLRSKLPPEIEELCVVWLGSGPDSQKALEKSVFGITQRKVNWNAPKEGNQIDQYAHQLDAERREQARLRHDMRSCRESDIYLHSKLFGTYSGTRQQIAIQINGERDRFPWFADRPSGTTDPTVTADDLVRMAQIHRKLTPDLVEKLQQRLFPLNQLIQPNEFFHLVEAEQRANTTHKQAQDKRCYPGYAQLSALDRKNRDAIKNKTEEILSTKDTLSKHFQPWAERASREISGGHDQIWRQIHASTIGHLEYIEQLLKKHGTLDVAGIGTKDFRLVKEHAAALKKHLESGKSFGVLVFRAQAVKEGHYLLKSVTVNGKLCNNIQTLSQLIAWVDTTTKIKDIADLWKGITTPPNGNAVLKCSAYRDLCKLIEQALTLSARIEEVRLICRDCKGIVFPAWHAQEEIRAFNHALDALNIEEDFTKARAVFIPLVESLTNFMNSGHSHTSAGQLLKAVNERDGVLYRDTYEALSSLHSCSDAYSLMSAIRERFHICAPRTCESYEESHSELAWDERFARFESAWVWAKTDRWLDEVGDKERPEQMQRALELSASHERDALSNLAASKAWHHCITSLREKERMALVAWAQAVAKIKGGTGKYAEIYRETARQKLDECRRAIPAWVMPLYQVVQTTRPGIHQFDVVIIDEASQSGPEALLLNYIADKIIVVGDDKQITPMHVGVDREQVLYLRRKYLKGIPHEETLDLEGSLFAQAELRFPDRIRLREHFRCMPEIIQFSNNLSYSNEPLIPLRQYGAERIEPVRTEFIKEGYRKGSSDDIVNPPEAEAIVSKIAECAEDPAYTGKTFGVISLMGSSQAELITTLLLGKNGIGAQEMEKRRLVCGRPYDFQGDERDVMFLSMVDAPQDGQPMRMIRDADTQRRFNVAASRARDQLWLFHSASLNDLRPGCLRFRLLEYCLDPKVDQSKKIGETTIAELRLMACNSSLRQTKRNGDRIPGTPFESWFEVDVFLKIIDRGYRVLPQYEVAGYRIDLVVEGLRGRLAVECDGDEWHGPDKYESDMARQRDLTRSGWVFWRVRGSDFYRDSTVALAGLWETLETLKITPWDTWESDKEQAETAATAEDRGSASASAEELNDNPDNDEEEAEGEEEREDGSAPTKMGEGRLDRALEYARLRSRQPEERPPIEIQNAIINSLRNCPNHSCTLKSLTTRVLKELRVRTRGNPRLDFEKRVMRNLGALKRKGLVEEYKAKNMRIRLLPFGKIKADEENPRLPYG